jgi:hypothetical protein
MVVMLRVQATNIFLNLSTKGLLNLVIYLLAELNRLLLSFSSARLVMS